MEFLVIVLFVVAIVVVNFLVTRAQRRKGSGSPDAPHAEGVQPDQQRAAKPQRAPRKTSGAKAAPAGPRTSAEAAREANARLDAAQHQQVYAAIAQGHPIGAVKLYAQFTGVGVRAAAAAVENLAMHPQPFQPPRTSGSHPAVPGQGTPAPRSDSTETPGAGDDGTASRPAGPAGPGHAGSAEPGAAGDSTPGSAASANAGSDSGSGSESSAAPAGQQSGPADRKPATPEEDEISKWVKNLRPEDF